ncbi:MAG TPA: hypothetical protein ENI60_04310, partial [Candidatus Fraserbacteria bacterium]|nr:hypothetical protein [Candidatus Fraserbacteria bacterium]
MSTKKRPVAANDILKFRFLGSPQLAPDGEQILFPLMIADAQNKKYHQHLWMMPFAEGQARQYTFGEVIDSAPSWSPDGLRIAFIRTRDKVSQIYLIPTDGGEARQLSRLEPGVIGGPCWSPDGSQLAFSYHPKAIADPEHPEKPPAVRQITRLRYQEQGYGFLDPERDHIYTLSVGDGRLTQLTEEDFDDQMPAWSPDGLRIAFISNRHPEADYHSLEEDIWLVPAGGGSPQALPTPKGPKALPRWSPDGQQLAYLGHAHPEDSWGTRNTHVWIASLQGGAVQDLMAKLDRPAEDVTISDTRPAHGSGQPPLWSADGRFVYTLVSDRGSCQLYRLPVSGGEPEALTSGPQEILNFSLAGPDNRAALAIADPLCPGDIYTLEQPVPGSSPRRCTELNGELLAQLSLSEPEEFEYASSDGTKI